MSQMQRWLLMLLPGVFPVSVLAQGLEQRSLIYCPDAGVRYGGIYWKYPAYVLTRPAMATSPQRPVQDYAQPTAAPPSAAPASVTPAPAAPRVVPPSDRKPQVSESHSFFDTYAGAPRDPAQPANDRCTVGFWNLTDHDVTVKVDGKAHTLASGKNIKLEVVRQFVWQAEGRDPQRENIAMGESALEIVIRR